MTWAGPRWRRPISRLTRQLGPVLPFVDMTVAVPGPGDLATEQSQPAFPASRPRGSATRWMIKDHDLDDVRSTEVPKYRSVSSSRSEKGQPVGRRGSRRSSWCPHSSHLAVQLLHDACGVILGALDEQRLAL